MANPKNNRKSSNLHKYILDLTMTIIMILLMKLTFTGMLWHEILGLAVFFLFMIHQVFNWTYTKNILKRFFNKGMKWDIRLGMIIDLILLVDVAGIALTGILISKEIFSFGVGTLKMSAMHHSLSYLALILISVHLGLHWKSIMNGMKKMFRLKAVSTARTVFMRFLTLLIVLAGIRGSFSQTMYTKVTDGFLYEEDEDEVSEAVGVGYETEDLKDAATATTGSTSEKDDPDLVPVADVVTLEEYLSKLHCDGCNKHCPLTAPQCSTGVREAQEATKDYNATLQSAATASSSTSNPTATPTESSPSSTTNPTATEDTDLTDSQTPTLQEYLGSLFCNQCPKHCSLTAPQCGGGEEMAAEATKEYYATIAVEGQLGETNGNGNNSPTILEALTDFVPIMVLYIAGTHYLVMFPKSMKKDQDQSKA